MAFNARVLRLLVAAPGDVESEVEAIKDVALRWDGQRSSQAGLLFLPRHWKTDAVPQLIGTDGQTVINRQLVDDADVVISVFHTRLGHPTPRAASGTAEELQQAEDAGKPVHVYFSRAAYPSDVDLRQVELLRDFRKALHLRGLVGDFDDIADLREQIMAALEQDAIAFADEALADYVPPVGPTTARAARLRATYAEEREARSNRSGGINHHISNQRIMVENQGDGTAQRVALRLEPMNTNRPAPEVQPAVQPDILGHSTFPFPVLVTHEHARYCNLTMFWEEEGQLKQETQAISLT